MHWREMNYFKTRRDRLLPFDTNKDIQMTKNSKLENDSYNKTNELH